MSNTKKIIKIVLRIALILVALFIGIFIFMTDHRTAQYANNYLDKQITKKEQGQKTPSISTPITELKNEIPPEFIFPSDVKEVKAFHTYDTFHKKDKYSSDILTEDIIIHSVIFEFTTQESSSLLISRYQNQLRKSGWNTDTGKFFGNSQSGESLVVQKGNNFLYPTLEIYTSLPADGMITVKVKYSNIK